MKVGDLVRLNGDRAILLEEEKLLIGIITNVGSIDGYYEVRWNDGTCDIDMIDMELVLVEET